MRALLAAVIVSLGPAGLSACAGARGTDAPSAALGDEGVRVLVLRDGDVWTADYELDSEAAVWAFRRSALARDDRQPWRPRQWTVQTPGVVMERHGHYDVLRAVDGGPVPRRLRLALTPQAADLEADYDPALVFADGAVALYTGHFDVFPMASVAAVEALPADLNGVDIPGKGPATIRWRDTGGPLLYRGERHDAVTARAADTYVLFGDASIVEGEDVTTVIDGGLPAWVGNELRDFTPLLFDHYIARLGPKTDAHPMILASWNGPVPGLSSMGGSVMPGMISMAFSGEGMLEASPGVMHRARWFIGHEAAHFWLGQTVGYERRRDAWITEGGADLMAIRALKRLDPAYDDREALQEEVDDCTALAAQSVAEAAGRGEHRAHYACGAVFALVAEAAQRRRDGGDWFDWLRPLIDANREDQVVTRAEWLDHLDMVSGDPSLRGDIERLLDHGAEDPAAVIAGLLRRAGVAFERGEDGAIRLL